MRILLIALGLALHLVLLQQLAAQPRPDSLWNLWNSSHEDSVRYEAMTRLIWQHMYTRPDSAYALAQLLEQDAKEKGHIAGQAQALNTKGASYYLRGELGLAGDYFAEALQLARQARSKKLEASNLNNLAMVRAEQGDHGAAVALYEASLELARGMSDTLAMGKALGNMGLLYQFQQDYERAIRFHTESLAMEEALGNTQGKALTYLNLGSIYKQQKQHKAAIAMYRESLALLRNSGDLHSQANCLNNLGTLWYEMAAFDTDSTTIRLHRSLGYQEEALRIREQLKDKQGMASSLINIGAVYTDLRHPGKALEYSRRAEILARESGNLLTLTNASHAMYKGHKGLAQYREALLHHEDWVLLRDSLNSLDNLRETARFEARYEYKLKALGDSLRAENEKAELRLATQLSVAQRSRDRNLYLSGFVLLLLLSGMAYQRQRNKARLRENAIEAQYQQELLYATINSQEQERRRIARDLHDEVGAMLSTIKLNLAAVRMQLQRQGFDQDLTAPTRNLVDDTIDNVRSISKDLLPPTLEEFGLAQALRELTDKVATASGIPIHTHIEAPAQRLQPEQELALYRVVQELINNALKHAEATEMQLELRCKEGALHLTFADKGKGFDLHSIRHSKEGMRGLGLKNLENRVGAAGGLLQLRSAPGHGTSASITLPLNKPQTTAA